jgi:hypothetical protein
MFFFFLRYKVERVAPFLIPYVPFQTPFLSPFVLEKGKGLSFKKEKVFFAFYVLLSFSKDKNPEKVTCHFADGGLHR